MGVRVGAGYKRFLDRDFNYQGSLLRVNSTLLDIMTMNPPPNAMNTPTRVNTLGIMNTKLSSKPVPTEWLVVPLPDLVQAKNQEGITVFEDKGRIYRFEKDAKQWKERSAGSIKIEKILNQEDKFVYRILSIRETVQKVGCNQLINKEMELKPMPNTWPMVGVSRKAWCWYNTDHSEDLDGGLHYFAVKFSSEVMAAQFKLKVSECQQDLRNEWTKIKSSKKCRNHQGRDTVCSDDLFNGQNDECSGSAPSRPEPSLI